MKFEEALINLRDGEKVTRTCWPKGCYLELKEGLLYDEDGYLEEICTDSIFLDDWILYKEKEEYKWDVALDEIKEINSHLAHLICNKANLNQVNDLVLRVHYLEERIKLLEKK